MKNLTMFSVLFAFLFVIFGFSGTALASQQCGNPALNNASSTVQYVACDNGSPENVVGGWGTNNAGVPHVHPGQMVTDDVGISSACPEFFSHDCVDITHTPYYIQQMKNLAAQLQSAQIISQFLKMQGWVRR